MAPLFVSVNKAAQALGISENEVQRDLVASGALQEFRDRGRVMLKYAEVEGLLRSMSLSEHTLSDRLAELARRESPPALEPTMVRRSQVARILGVSQARMPTLQSELQLSTVKLNGEEYCLVSAVRSLARRYNPFEGERILSGILRGEDTARGIPELSKEEKDKREEELFIKCIEDDLRERSDKSAAQPVDTIELVDDSDRLEPISLFEEDESPALLDVIAPEATDASEESGLLDLFDFDDEELGRDSIAGLSNGLLDDVTRPDEPLAPRAGEASLLDLVREEAAAAQGLVRKGEGPKSNPAELKNCSERELLSEWRKGSGENSVQGSLGSPFEKRILASVSPKDAATRGRVLAEFGRRFEAIMQRSQKEAPEAMVKVWRRYQEEYESEAQSLGALHVVRTFVATRDARVRAARREIEGIVRQSSRASRGVVAGYFALRIFEELSSSA